MAKPAIKVEGLWKEYVIGAQQKAHGTFYDMLSSSLAAPFRALRKRTTEEQEAESFWALRDINFEVQPGEVVGIIGRNGAGKSTLLKILSRITAPTRGHVEVRGRLASLLEVGTGFHPELSGRENIFLNGAILGMTRAEVTRKFDDIVAFAEIEKFVDTPVKRYSSGMYVRLAFSVAAHLEPDILIIDEVLAVGDAAFQQRCFGKMEQVRKDGRTVVVVSHNLQLIGQLCKQGLLLQSGELTFRGPFEKARLQYLSRDKRQDSWRPAIRDGGVFQYESVAVEPSAEYSPSALPADLSFCIAFHFTVSQEFSGRLALAVRDELGTTVFTSSDTDGRQTPHKQWSRGQYVERCEIPGNLLVPGAYWVAISRPRENSNEVIEEALCFTVSDVGSLVSRDGREGCIAPQLKWTMQAL